MSAPDDLKFRTWTVDYAVSAATFADHEGWYAMWDELHDSIVDLFASHGLKVDGCTDGPLVEDPS